MISRWPASHTKRAPQKVHAIPQRLQNSRVFTPPPVKLLRAVHPPVAQLRAIDMAPVLLRAERDVPKPQPVTEGDRPRPSARAGVLRRGDFVTYSGRNPDFRDQVLVVCSVDSNEACCSRADKNTIFAPLDTLTLAPRGSQPAPVAAPQPAGARFVVGQRISNGHFEYDVLAVNDAEGTCDLRAVKSGRTFSGSYGDVQWTIVKPVEPLPSETPESGDWTPPGFVQREPQNFHHAATDTWVWFGDVSHAWTFARGTGVQASEQKYDSLAQAACAALGIEIVQGQNSGLWLAAREGDLLACLDDQCRDAEQAARRALAALHARGMRP